jgi:hypothetical protein
VYAILHSYTVHLLRSSHSQVVVSQIYVSFKHKKQIESHSSVIRGLRAYHKTSWIVYSPANANPISVRTWMSVKQSNFFRDLFAIYLFLLFSSLCHSNLIKVYT